MAKKKREKVKIIEAVQFDDYDRAKRAVTYAKINQIRILIGLAFAIAAMVFTVRGLKSGESDLSNNYAWAFVLAIPAYLIGGGIGKAIKTAWNITKFGWFLIPVFPADVLFGIMFFIISLFLLMFVPIVFVGLNFIQHKKTLDAAKSYLGQCGYAITSTEE